MIASTLTRMTTVNDAAEFEKRAAALAQRLQPLLDRQPGFVSRELRRDGDGGAMVEITRWQTMDDCRAYLRNGGAAMAATMLDAFFPTAPYPNGSWLRANEEVTG
jgi:heme-degrading monooxygenase HmoA